MSQVSALMSPSDTRARRFPGRRPQPLSADPLPVTNATGPASAGQEHPATTPGTQAALGDGLARLGLPLAPAVQESLLHYLALLAKWNRVYNLSAIRDPAQMLTHHLLDSLAALPVLRQDRLDGRGRPVSLIDVGAGAGLPGIPLALSWPMLSLTLAEPVGKKAAFLRQCVAELGLAHRVRVHAARVETLATTDPPADLIICRAFASLRDFALAVRHLVTPDTQVWAMKGRRPDAELEELPPDWRLADLRTLEVPSLDAQRHLLRLEPVAALREEPSP